MTLSVDGKVQILNGATSAVASASYRMDGGGIETVEAYGRTLSGTGAAVIEIQVSNDNLIWQTAGTINLNLRPTQTSDKFTMDASWLNWLYIRAKLASISGTGASVSVYKITGAGNVGTAQTNFVSGDLTPVLLIGGDHPVTQWYGTNGVNGLARMYADAGIVPYLALNTNSLTGEGVGDTASLMTWEQVKYLADAGLVEPVAHGARHYQDWEAPDAGIHVRYVGPAATATMYVTSTAVIGTTAGSVEDFNFTFASYPTVDELVAAIDALPNWTSMRSTELLGTEASDNLLTIASGNAKNCKTGLPDATRGQRFSMAGGLRIFWDSTTTACDSFFVYMTPTVLNLLRDGVTVASFTLSSYTLSTLLTAIKAYATALVSTDPLAGRDITSLMNDNGASGYAYCTGEEDASNLTRRVGDAHIIDAKRAPAIIHACGLTPSYLRQRNMDKCKETAAANGIIFKAFAQSGGNFWSYLSSTSSSGTFEHYRGNSRWNGTAPCPIPTKDASNWHPHIGLGGAYNSTEAVNALIAGIVASKGFTTDLLIHGVVTDAAVSDNSVTGSSGYYLGGGFSTDITEAAMVSLLAAIKSAVSAGNLRVIKQSDLNSVAASAAPPQNLLFNPRIAGRATASLLATNNQGINITGWRYDGWGLPAITLLSNGIEFSSSGSTNKLVLSQRVIVERGARYRAGFRLETDGTVQGICLRATAVYGGWPDSMVPGSQLTYAQGHYFTRNMDDVVFNFEIPWSKANGNPRIVSLNTGPYDLSTNKNIRLGMENSGSGSNIDCSAGAVSSSAVTAKEVAAAINASIAANATYAAKTELHNLARAENGKVVLEMRRRQGNPYSVGALQIYAGTSASATDVIFGGSTGLSWTNHAGESDSSCFPVELGVWINATTVGRKIRVIDPYLVKFNNGR